MPRRILLVWLAAVFYIAAGAMHFVAPATYLKIMPPFIPWPLAMVYLSGAAEIACGIGLLIPFLRRQAAWATVALLVAIFPANVYMAINNIPAVAPWILWARLPLQALLIWWVLWSTKPAPPQLSTRATQ